MELVHCIYVKEYWDHIRYALECVIEKTNADWIPEDVYAACMMGQARVYLAPDGVIVFKLLTDNITNQNSLFVWAAYSKEGNALVKYYQDVDAIAQEFGASKISFASPRKAWHRAIHKIPGWYEVETVYEKRI